MDLIFTHPSGGELWQGGMDDVDRLLRAPNERIKVVGLFAQEYQPDDHFKRYELIQRGFDDNFEASDAELSAAALTADEVSDLFSDRLRRGKGVLSSCAAGLNRSGLVSALTLMKVGDMGPDEAIGRIRRLRSPHALSNPRFVEALRRMGGSQGAKSTWTNWGR